MKLQTFMIILTLLLLSAFGGFFQMHTVVDEKQQQIYGLWEEIAALEKQIYYYTLPKEEYVEPLKEYWLSSSVGYRVDPMGGGEEKLHKGVDLITYSSAEVMAVMDGIVVAHWPSPDGFYRGHPIFGGFIVIEHRDGLLSLYGHLSETFVHQGEFVQRGQRIGIVGNTGISTGEHLHLEIIVNPFEYLERR